MKKKFVHFMHSVDLLQVYTQCLILTHRRGTCLYCCGLRALIAFLLM